MGARLAALVQDARSVVLAEGGEDGPGALLDILLDTALKDSQAAHTTARAFKPTAKYQSLLL